MGRKLISAKGLFDFNRAIDAASERADDISVKEFRKAVWAVFEELVLTTPQYSGRAAANWNIGIDQPDFSVDYNLGEQEDVVPAKKGGHKIEFISPRHVGDMKWAEETFQRNKHKLRQITRSSRVYITNATQGEVDRKNGRSSSYYLADLQDPTYWAKRLREANQPYETVSQVLLMESWRLRLNENLMEKAFFK